MEKLSSTTNREFAILQNLKRKISSLAPRKWIIHLYQSHQSGKTYWIDSRTLLQPASWLQMISFTSPRQGNLPSCYLQNTWTIEKTKGNEIWFLRIISKNVDTSKDNFQYQIIIEEKLKVLSAPEVVYGYAAQKPRDCNDIKLLCSQTVVPRRYWPSELE